MEPLVAMAVVAVVAVLLVSPLLAVFALARVQTLARQVGDLRVELSALKARVDRAARPPAPPVPAPGSEVRRPPVVAAPPAPPRVEPPPTPPASRMPPVAPV